MNSFCIFQLFGKHRNNQIPFDAEGKHIYLIKQMFCLFACFYSNNPAMPKIISFTNGGMRPLNVKLFGRQASGGGRTLTNVGFKTKMTKSDCCESSGFFSCVCVSRACPQTLLVRRERGGAESGRRIPAEVAFVREVGGRVGGGGEGRWRGGDDCDERGDADSEKRRAARRKRPRRSD